MLEEGIFDIHCHIVPGVDDGAADIEETRKLLEMEYKQGVRNIILTPHFRFQMFETPLEKYRDNSGLQKRRQQISVKICIFTSDANFMQIWRCFLCFVRKSCYHGWFQVCAGRILSQFRGILYQRTPVCNAFRRVQTHCCTY